MLLQVLTSPYVAKMYELSSTSPEDRSFVAFRINFLGNLVPSNFTLGNTARPSAKGKEGGKFENIPVKMG